MYRKIFLGAEIPEHGKAVVESLQVFEPEIFFGWNG
jgi:hypothetical protein